MAGRLRQIPDKPWGLAYSQHIHVFGRDDPATEPNYDHDEYNDDKYPGWRNEYPYNETKEKQPGYPDDSEGLHHHPEYGDQWKDKKKEEPPAQKSATSHLVSISPLVLATGG